MDPISIAIAIAQQLLTLVPELVGAYQKYKAGEITADQLKATADASYQAMLAKLVDPSADAKATNDAEDAAAAEQFAGK